MAGFYDWEAEEVLGDQHRTVHNELGFIKRGSGAPEGSVTADVGSVFIRSDGGSGTTVYIKESGSGNTGWVAVASASDHGALSGLTDDDHTQYRLESADHSHQSTGLQGGQITVAALSDTPGGELGGTWASPTVDATHSGSTHSAATDTHIADGTDAHDASAISILDTAADFDATDVEGALAELQSDAETHAAAADPHTGYRLESADHTHASAGAQAGQLDHGLALTGLTDDDHTQYLKETDVAAKGDIYVASANDTVGVLSVGTDGQIIVADAAESLGVKWANNTGGSGAPTDADYLVGTANGSLSNEIVVGATPGGELGGTWASPTVDATHSGSAHHTQSHDHSGAGDGTAVRPATLDLPSAAAPTPTTLAEIAYGTTENALFVGDGTGTKQFLPTVDATSDPAAVSTAAADGTEDTAARKDHVHAHEAAHINHDTTWAAKGDLIAGTANDTAAVRGVGADGTFLRAASGEATGMEWFDHAGAADPHTGYRLESADHTHASSGAQAGTIDHGALTGLTDDDHTQYLKESDVDAVTFTLGMFFDGNGSTLATGRRPIWRAPFDCTVTQVRGYVDTGTTTVINAGTTATAGSEEFCSADITIDPADAWESGTVNQNQSVTAGETVSVEIITAGTATQLTVQIELTRDLSP